MWLTYSYFTYMNFINGTLRHGSELMKAQMRPKLRTGWTNIYLRVLHAAIFTIPLNQVLQMVPTGKSPAFNFVYDWHKYIKRNQVWRLMSSMWQWEPITYPEHVTYAAPLTEFLVGDLCDQPIYSACSISSNTFLSSPSLLFLPHLSHNQRSQPFELQTPIFTGNDIWCKYVTEWKCCSWSSSQRKTKFDIDFSPTQLCIVILYLYFCSSLLHRTNSLYTLSV